MTSDPKIGPWRLREATPADAQAIAEVHVRSWRETYTGLMPQAVRDGLSVERRPAGWTRMLTDPTVATKVWVAETDGGLVGFGAAGPQRSPDLADQGFSGEIEAVYVLASCQGQGIGGALIHRMATHLIAQGHRTAALWVLRENAPARAVYERLGGVVCGEQTDDRMETVLVESAYGWTDLAALKERLRPSAPRPGSPPGR